jgi:hypothetical protein
MTVGYRVRSGSFTNSFGGEMDNVIRVHFTPEAQDLLGTAEELYEAADQEMIVSLAYAAQADDGTYEIYYCGDIGHYSMIEALQKLIRELRKDAKKKQ